MTWAKFITIIGMVESSFDVAAINEKENAIGLLQIRPCVVEDVNNHYGTDFNHLDCYDTVVASTVCVLYIKMWCKKKKYKCHVENAARIWNGGPDGPNKDSTLAYLNKIKGICDEKISVIKRHN